VPSSPTYARASYVTKDEDFMVRVLIAVMRAGQA
jgi:hypothetical protein